MKILHLTLKKKWFDMIASGEKPEEYREMKPYWIKRLSHYGEYIAEMNGIYFGHETRKFDFVKFRSGYATDAPTLLIECHGIERGIGNPAWGAPEYPVFIIKLGKIIEESNARSCKRAHNQNVMKKYQDQQGNTVEAIQYDGSNVEEVKAFCPEVEQDEEGLSLDGVKIAETDYVGKDGEQFFVYEAEHLTEIDGGESAGGESDPE